MKPQLFAAALASAAAMLAAGCATPALAPGADQVKITHEQAEVAGCKSLGPVKSVLVQPDRDIELRNGTQGLGGNVVLINDNVFKNEGTAYRCGR